MFGGGKKAVGDEIARKILVKIFVIGGTVDSSLSPVETELFKQSCAAIGRSLGQDNHTILVCSPFGDAADIHVLAGAIQLGATQQPRIEYHFIDNAETRSELDKLVVELHLTNLAKVPHPAPKSADKASLSYAWLLCQLSALESCDATVAIGGNEDGAANMLLLLAEGRRKPVLPYPSHGGAARMSFERCRHQLQDVLGEDFLTLHSSESLQHAAKFSIMLMEQSQRGGHRHGKHPRFFISYPRRRQSEADYVETLLRRRNLQVFRDESDFGAGADVHNEIIQAIHGANIFIALWSAEYACSPWCSDELDLALDRHDSNSLDLWLFRVDATRMVPKRARGLITYDTNTRGELEAKVLDLLARLA